MKLTLKSAQLLTHSLMATLLALYLINKFIWRTQPHNNLFVTIFKGSLPNLIAAILFPLIFIEGVLKAKTLQELKRKNRFCRIIILITLGILILEEFYPIFSGSKVFDYWDIIFSIIGAGFALYYLSFISRIVKKSF